MACSACRTTLVSASWMIRKAAWSTAAGSGGRRRPRAPPRPSGPPGAARRPGRPAGPARAAGARGSPPAGIAEHLQRRPQLGQRLPAGGPDRLQRRRHLVRSPVQHVQRHPGLHGDHRQAVADHVVHVAGDPHPLLVRVPAPVLLPGHPLTLPPAAPEQGEQGRHDGQRDAEHQPRVQRGVEQPEVGLATSIRRRSSAPAGRSAAAIGAAAGPWPWRRCPAPEPRRPAGTSPRRPGSRRPRPRWRRRPAAARPGAGPGRRP